jgi:NAD(P)-dependent dehydrogenase (short-subunit alcohol dehydrogenase family)
VRLDLAARSSGRRGRDGTLVHRVRGHWPTHACLTLLDSRRIPVETEAATLAAQKENLEAGASVLMAPSRHRRELSHARHAVRRERRRSPAALTAGGSAEATEVDALDEQAGETHLQSVIEEAGRLDISFNAIGISNPKIRLPLVELDAEQFSLPIATYTRSYFLTARMAARRMVANTSGVIMTVTATPSRTGTPLVGGGGPAMAAVEALTRESVG